MGKYLVETEITYTSIIESKSSGLARLEALQQALNILGNMDVNGDRYELLNVEILQPQRMDIHNG